MRSYFGVFFLLCLVCSAKAFSSTNKGGENWHELRNKIRSIQKSPYKNFRVITKDHTYLAHEFEDKGNFVVFRTNTEKKNLKTGKTVFEEYYVQKSSIVGLSYKVLR